MELHWMECHGSLIGRLPCGLTILVVPLSDSIWCVRCGAAEIRKSFRNKEEARQSAIELAADTLFESLRVLAGEHVPRTALEVYWQLRALNN
jgi:hypothetical protein